MLIRMNKKLSGLLGLGFMSVSAFAAQMASEHSASQTCGVLNHYEGDLRILDASRNFLKESTPGAALRCGSWISTGPASSTEIRTSGGQEMRLGPQTFLELPKKASDPMVLYRGELLVRTEPVNPGYSVETVNGRVRIEKGMALISYDGASQETRLVTLDRQASLENRFEGSRRVIVRAGEISTLNLKQMRVVPSVPKPVSIASMAPYWKSFKIAETDKDRMLSAMKQVPATDQDRKPASVRHPKPSNYERAAPFPQKEWLSRVTGGSEEEAEAILTPSTARQKARKIEMSVEDPSSASRAPASVEKPKNHPDEIEKKKIIEELSKIQNEN